MILIIHRHVLFNLEENEITHDSRYCLGCTCTFNYVQSLLLPPCHLVHSLTLHFVIYMKDNVGLADNVHVRKHVLCCQEQMYTVVSHCQGQMYSKIS